MVIRCVHRLSRILLTCPAQVHFRVLTRSIRFVTFVFSLTQMSVFLSQYVMFNILLSIFVRLLACVVYLSFKARSYVTLEDIAVHGESCPSGRDSSLNLLVLDFFSGAVSLSHLDVAFNAIDLSVVDIYWCVVFHHHLCLRLVHLEP